MTPGNPDQVVAVDLSVLAVLGIRCFAQVGDSVACLDAVAVVDLMLGPMTFDERVDDAMGQQWPLAAAEGEGDAEIAIAYRRSGRRPSAAPVPAPMFLIGLEMLAWPLTPRRHAALGVEDRSSSRKNEIGMTVCGLRCGFNSLSSSTILKPLLIWRRGWSSKSLLTCRPRVRLDSSSSGPVFHGRGADRRGAPPAPGARWRTPPLSIRR